jgi:hypothetical protein
LSNRCRHGETWESRNSASSCYRRDQDFHHCWHMVFLRRHLSCCMSCLRCCWVQLRLEMWSTLETLFFVPVNMNSLSMALGSMSHTSLLQGRRLWRLTLCCRVCTWRSPTMLRTSKRSSVSLTEASALQDRFP